MNSANLFSSTLNQLAFLFGLIAIGYILVKIKVLKQDSASVLSKLENWVFLPGLIIESFINDFTLEKISSAWKMLLISSAIALVVIVIAILIPKLVTKDKYIQNIYTYGLSFSNFGFMGNAVVSSLFPEIFFEYIIFTLPLWILIYIWGVPRLLIADAEKKQTLKESLKQFINPMFISLIIGVIIGLTGIKLPEWIVSIVSVSGDCMSPVAMLLTGIAVSAISLKKTFTNISIYIISVVRLVVLPLIFIGANYFLNLPEVTYICAICSLAMPLGLNTIVIPSGYGKDTSVAAGMALISHLLSVITIPLIFSLI